MKNKRNATQAVVAKTLKGTDCSWCASTSLISTKMFLKKSIAYLYEVSLLLNVIFDKATASS